VGDLLTLARADAGELPVVRERVHLDERRLEAVEALRRGGAKGRQTEVVRLKKRRSSAILTWRAGSCLIVLDNAIKYTPPGHSPARRDGGNGKALGHRIRYGDRDSERAAASHL